MKILLVTYSFPPAAGVGVLRAFSLAKYLPDAGIQVEVLTAGNAAAVGRDESLLAQLPSSVSVLRTWTPDVPFGLRKAIKKLVSSRKGAARAKTDGNRLVPARVALPGQLQSLVGDLLLPDPQVGWVPFALRAASRRILHGGIDLVLVTVPPFSSVRLVTLLRRRFPELPIVLDFRDEWLTSTLHLVSFSKTERARRVASNVESEGVRDATAVVCVTEAAVQELRSRYGDTLAGRIHCIPNGFDLDEKQLAPFDPAFSTGFTVLTYIGTVYGSTNPAPVVEAVLALPIAVRNRLRLRFIGHIETTEYRENLLRLGQLIELIPFLPQAQALRYIDSTTYLLLITHDRINVAAKLYDYLGSGRPILGAVHATGDVRRILEETKAGWTADIDDVTAISSMLTEAVERTTHLQSTFRPDCEKINSFHRRPLAARYGALLRSLSQAAQTRER